MTTSEQVGRDIIRQAFADMNDALPYPSPADRRAYLRRLASNMGDNIDRESAGIRVAVGLATFGVHNEVREQTWLDLVIAVAQQDSIHDGSLEPRELYPNLAAGREYEEATAALEQVIGGLLDVLVREA